MRTVRIVRVHIYVFVTNILKADATTLIAATKALLETTT